MKYVDGYVMAVPKKKLKEYLKMAKLGAKIWRRNGALEYFETVGDDLNPKWNGMKFPQTMKAKPGDTVVFSFIVYNSRAHRDKVNAKVMKDPLMVKAMKEPMPIDMKHAAYGGFQVMVEA